MGIYIKEAAQSSYTKNGNPVFRFEVSADTLAELQQFADDMGANKTIDETTGRLMYFTRYPKFRAGGLVRGKDGRWFLDTSEMDVLEAQMSNASSPVLAELLGKKLVALTTEIPKDFEKGKVVSLEAVEADASNDAADEETIADL